MRQYLHILTLGLAMTAGSLVHAQSSDFPLLHPETRASAPSVLGDQRDAIGLPGLRPRLTMTLPLDGATDVDDRDARFSWSLEAWQLNTASLAHIHCNRLTPTIDSYLAEDCRFVDQPLPENAVNLIQVRGQWQAAPGLSLGLGAQLAPPSSDLISPPVRSGGESALPYLSGGLPLQVRPAAGVDVNLSFGISHERVGDFLVGLQLARYQQRMSLLDFGLGGLDPAGLASGEFQHYANSAQLALGWRRGSFSGDLLGYARDVPVWLGNGQYSQAALNSFDLEFSWRAVRNASISIGVSNVLDAAPRAADESLLDAGMEDPLEHVFGRIPYVRYKHDL